MIAKSALSCRLLVSLCFCLALLALPSLSHAAESKNTATYLQAHAEKLIGKNVSLDVTHVEKVKTPARAVGVAFFKAYTYDKKNRSKGGTIIVAIPNEESGSLLRRYGSAPKLTVGAKRRADTRTFRGVLGKNKKDRLLVCKNQEVYDKVPGLVKPAASEDTKKK